MKESSHEYLRDYGVASSGQGRKPDAAMSFGKTISRSDAKPKNGRDYAQLVPKSPQKSHMNYHDRSPAKKYNHNFIETYDARSPERITNAAYRPTDNVSSPSKPLTRSAAKASKPSYSKETSLARKNTFGMSMSSATGQGPQTAERKRKTSATRGQQRNTN